MKVKTMISIWMIITIGIGCAGLTIKTVSNDELEISKIPYPMSEEKAKEFKSNPPKEWIPIMDVKSKVQSIKYYDCREPGKFPVTLSENRYKEVKDSYFAYYCKPKPGKLKVFRGKLLAIDFIE